MKKLVMMLVCMFAVHTMVMADNDKHLLIRKNRLRTYSSSLVDFITVLVRNLIH